MQAETALGRVGLWFLVMLAAMAAALGAADSGFAAHAWIIAALGFVMVWVSASRFDPLGRARGFFKLPDGPSRYDDDPIRWGVI
ncbi:MAG TPA: cytochrome-c oxidase, cbb3-type subunit I, partial [Erythrobacter sp.]|nr:cytochrome-c oxidase, cbb3-type subunit I [Erythrobacter sp.]